MFEILFWAGLGLLAVNAYAVASNPNAAGVLQTDSPVRVVIVELAIGTAINLVLLWLIAYRASNIGRWVFVGLVVIGALLDSAGFGHEGDMGDLSVTLTLLQYGFCVIEIFLLFRRDARDWFAGREPVDPEIFS